MAAPAASPERLGDLLVREGLISREQLTRALSRNLNVATDSIIECTERDRERPCELEASTALRERSRRRHREQDGLARLALERAHELRRGDRPAGQRIDSRADQRAIDRSAARGGVTRISALRAATATGFPDSVPAW